MTTQNASRHCQLTQGAKIHTHTPRVRTAAVESGVKALAKATSSLQEKQHKACKGPTASGHTHVYVLQQLPRFRPCK